MLQGSGKKPYNILIKENFSYFLLYSTSQHTYWRETYGYMHCGKSFKHNSTTNTSEDSYWENPTQVHSVEKPLGGVLTLSNTRGLILEKSKNIGKAGSLLIMAFTSFDTIEKLRD